MKKYLVFITLFFISGITPLAIADHQIQWDRGSAMAAVHSVDINSAVYELSDISSLADGQATLGKIKALETRADWPLPAREAAIHQFTRSLTEVPRDAVSPLVMNHLRAYEAQTLVPHEEHHDAFIPLFNIRAAAAGVENNWQRQESAFEAETLMKAGPDALIAGFETSTSPIQRQAYLEVLENAHMADVIALQDVVLGQLATKPALTPVLATTVTITNDPAAIQQLLIDGKGAGLSSALMSVGQQLSLPDISDMLVFAIQQAPAINATIAMAAWSPMVRHQASIRDLLIETLADTDLGAGAALALAHQPDIQTIKILQDTAAGTSLAAKRAQMALDLNRDHLIGETRP